MVVMCNELDSSQAAQDDLVSVVLISGLIGN